MYRENNRRNRMKVKHLMMLVIALVVQPLIAGCDIAKALAAIGQLVSAIAPSTGTAGTGATGAAGAPAAPKAAGQATVLTPQEAGRQPDILRLLEGKPK